MQALVARTDGPAAPRRAFSGLDAHRVAMVLAVLERAAGVKLGGATCSPRRSAGCGSPSRPPTWRWRSRWPAPAGDTRAAAGLVALGEVGLSGEMRRVGGVRRRLAEAARLGFTARAGPAGLPRHGARRACGWSEVADLGTAFDASAQTSDASHAHVHARSATAPGATVPRPASQCASPCGRDSRFRPSRTRP